MLRVFTWAEHSIAGTGTEGGHIYCTYTYTHTHRHIHTYTSQGLCEAIPRSCSSFSILFISGGDPGAPLQTTAVQPPQNNTVPSPGPRLCGATETLVLTGEFTARRTLQRAGQHTRQVHGQYLPTPQRASTRAAHGDHVAQLEGQVAPKPPLRTSFPPPHLCPRLCFLRCQSFPESRDHRAAAPASHRAAAGASSEPAAAAGEKMRLEHTPISSFIPLCL